MPGRRDLASVRAYYAKILPFYEKESRADAAARRAFWLGLARRWRPVRVLEVGCGLAWVAASLSRIAPAVGLDVSFDMLRRARRLPGRSRVRFVAADARDPVFRRAFGLIVAPSDPFCHLTAPGDRRRALRAVAEELAPGGRFVLDALSRCVRRPQEFERSILGRAGVLRISESWRPIAGGLWRAAYRYRDRGPGRRDRTLEASFVARSWDPGEIRSLFASCGLAVEELWGDYRRSSFRSDSRRLIVVARRA